MALLTEITLYVFVASFLSGFLITVFTGSAKAIKIYLALLTILCVIALVIGLILSRGILTFLLFQIITLVIIIFFFIIAGAALGGGMYNLIHKKSSYKKLLKTELADYYSLQEFSILEDLTEQRALSRIKNGYYAGGIYQGRMYINKAELSEPVDKYNNKVSTSEKENQ